jgi:hypothetical protein
MKYILFNELKTLYTRFDSEIHGEHGKGIPKQAIEVTDELFWRTINEKDGVWKLDPNGKITKHPFPAPTKEELAQRALNIATAKMAEEMKKANAGVAKYQDMVDLEVATEEEAAKLKAWKLFRVGLNRLDLTAKKIDWPKAPE